MYAKLFQQLLSSSLTEKETIEVRGVFFMLMAAADKGGIVLGSDETIARIINVPVGVFKRAASALCAPDSGSRNKEHEGRRLLPLDDSLGYFLTGYPKYSGIHTDSERRDYFRIKKQESRNRQRDSGKAPGTEKQHEAAKPILRYLSEKTGKQFRETDTNLAWIGGRLAEEGVTEEGCRQMIDHMVAMWKSDPKMNAYLRPETLFGKQKFDGYYAAKDSPVLTANTPLTTDTGKLQESIKANRL